MGLWDYDYPKCTERLSGRDNVHRSMCMYIHWSEHNAWHGETFVKSYKSVEQGIYACENAPRDEAQQPQLSG